MYNKHFFMESEFHSKIESIIQIVKIFTRQ